MVCDSDLPKRTFDVKPVYLLCQQNSINLKQVVFDALIAAYLLNSGSKSYSIRDLAMHMILGTVREIEEGYEDIALLSPLCDTLSNKLEQEELESLFSQVEMPLTGSTGRYGILRISCGC